MLCFECFESNKKSFLLTLWKVFKIKAAKSEKQFLIPLFFLNQWQWLQLVRRKCNTRVSNIQLKPSAYGICVMPVADNVVIIQTICNVIRSSWHLPTLAPVVIMFCPLQAKCFHEFLNLSTSLISHLCHGVFLQ